MSAPSSRPRDRAGCTVGEGLSHAGKSGVRGTAIAKKALREKGEVKRVKRESKRESEREWKRKNLYS